MRPTTSTAGRAASPAASNPATVAPYAGEPEPGAAPPGASPSRRVRRRGGGSRRILPAAAEPKVGSTGVVAVREAQNTSAGRASRALTEAHRLARAAGLAILDGGTAPGRSGNGCWT